MKHNDVRKWFSILYITQSATMVFNIILSMLRYNGFQYYSLHAELQWFSILFSPCWATMVCQYYSLHVELQWFPLENFSILDGISSSVQTSSRFLFHQFKSSFEIDSAEIQGRSCKMLPYTQETLFFWCFMGSKEE